MFLQNGFYMGVLNRKYRKMPLLGTLLPFWILQHCLYEIFIIGEVIYRDLILILKKKNSYHVPFLKMTSFIDVILLFLSNFQLNPHFRHYYLIFKQCLYWQKLFSMIGEIFWKNIFFTSCTVFDVGGHL